MSATHYKKNACRYLDLYRNDKRKKSGYKKNTRYIGWFDEQVGFDE